jgi:AcrR family transcriptional regulator
MPRVSDVPTIDEIRRVALEMFSRRGYDATSIRDIADAVGIRGASMYNHFPSKESILWELTDRALTELTQEWEAERAKVGDATPEARLRAFVQVDVRYHAIHRHKAAIVNARLGSLSAEHHAEVVRRRAEYEASLHEIVLHCTASRRPKMTATQLKLTVFAILQMCAAVAGWFRTDGDLGVDEVCQAYADMALNLVR